MLEIAQSGGATEILDREGGLITWRVDGRGEWRVPIPYRAISPHVIRATIAAEDKRFRFHHGIDPLALLRAVGQNVICGRRISGASTLTMQSIRLLWPRPRTWRSKCIESFRALQLERLCSKNEILQLYLNLAPYGGNMIGVEAAARQFFGKPASALTLGEAALLAGIPQSPARFDPRLHLNQALHRRRYVLRRMVALGLAERDAVERVHDQPIRLVRTPIRTRAPRFGDHCLLRLRTQGGVHRTTIAPDAQSITRGVLARHTQRFAEEGIDGLAAVVIDVRKATLIAAVGNSNASDPQTGCINGTTAWRQPGSLLKPFLYCRAYEQGILTPDSRVHDIPTLWRGYRPENMDRVFLGPLPAHRALRLSRNLPAVRLLHRLDTARCAEQLTTLGLRLRKPPRHYGLTLALGSAEMRLIDLANAYAALARLGSFRPLRTFTTDPLPLATPFTTPAAAWLTLHSLGARKAEDKIRPAWKTGTSWNHRDAWAMLITPQWVIGVWCGRFSGRGHPALTGATAALPIARELHERLGGPSPSWKRPAGIRTRRICAVSGAPRSASCRQSMSGESIAGVSSQVPCRLHGKGRTVAATPDRGEPPQRNRLAILSPQPGGEYVIPQEGSRQRLPLRVRGRREDEPIVWYLDQTYLGKSKAGVPLIWAMTPGPHTLIAATPSGAHAKVTFRVLE
jgi:penicillin-binding protein 1C